MWVNSPVTVGSVSSDDEGSLHNAFTMYQGTGTGYAPFILPETTYGSPGHGTIYVESSPAGAVIYLNDENKGIAPVTITDLWPGSYTISAERAGYQKYTSTTTVSGSSRSSVYCKLVPETSGNGLYVVSTPAPASVYLDGVLKGETPLMLNDTASGSHTLQVRRSGYSEWISAVEVPESGTKTVSAILNQSASDLSRGISISSNPGGATVILDSLRKGVTPLTLNTVTDGIHVLEIEYPGYTSWKSTVDVPKTGMKEIAVNLTLKPGSSPGWIAVSSDPCNALVTLDGVYVGRTPANSSLNLDFVAAGDHAIGLELPGYILYSTNATVLPNLISAVNATLIPVSVSGPLANGTLSVTSDPAGATISVDNRSIGMSPLDVHDIAPGNHLVTMGREGYENYSTSILVSAGTTSNVSATLLAIPPTLHSPLFPLAALGALGIIAFFSLRRPE
jgi:hypothetical protein